MNTDRIHRAQEGSRSASDTLPQLLLLRPCSLSEVHRIALLINASSAAYRGVVPRERWIDARPTLIDLASDIAHGMTFIGAEVEGRLAGVIAVHAVGAVDIVRHLYVLEPYQNRGIGSALLGHVVGLSRRHLLVAIWHDGLRAEAFFRRHGFDAAGQLASHLELINAYWSVRADQALLVKVMGLPAPGASEVRSSSTTA